MPDVNDVRDWGTKSSKVAPTNNNENNDASKRPPYLRAAFNMIDKDRSGFIDAEELSLLLKLQGINASKDDVKNIFKMYHSSSSNGDELSFEEFCVIMYVPPLDDNTSKRTHKTQIHAHTRKH